ncbi:MAG: ATP-binding protein [Vicinamibacteraceae bacterium]
MHSLQARLLIAVGALALAAIGLVAVAARQGTRLEFLRFADLQRREASGRLPALAARLAQALDGRCCSGEAISAATAQLPADVALLVVAASDGALIAAGGASVDAPGVRVVTRRDGDTMTIELTRRNGPRVGQTVLRLKQPPTPLRLADGRAAALQVLSLPRDDADLVEAAFFGALDRRLLAVAAIVGGLALMVTWAIVRGVTRPVEELQHASRAVAAGDLTWRVVPRGSRETVALGRAFNSMAADLERQETIRRDLVHDVAHELRTPLTDLRCRLEAVIDGLAVDPRQAVHDLLDDVRHLTRLADDLQELAQAEARVLAFDLQAVQVRPAVGAAIRTAGLDRDPRMTAASTLGDLAVRADPDRLREIVVNLLTNAARHTPDHGVITVAAEAAGDRVHVQVHNTGSMLDATAVTRLFDRFYRADPARGRDTGGSGLGLAIVKQLVEAQGGEVLARSDDTGVTVGFALPRAE